MALTDSQVMVLLSASVLFGRAAYVLSNFEYDLVVAVCDRFVEHRREAQITANEWPVIERAIEAMRAEVSLRRSAGAA